MRMRSISCLAAIVAGVLGTASVGAATLPTGVSFDINGSLQSVTASTFDQATALDFGQGTGPIVYGTPGGTITLGGTVNAIFGASGFVTGNQGTAQDLTSLTVGAQSIASFYSFISGASTLAFDLVSITFVNRVPGNSAFAIAPTLNVYGTGTLRLTGYDPTPGTFSLSASNTGTGPTTTFQSSVSSLGTTVVPEPASWALMVIGFGGMGAALRRRRPSTLTFA